MAGARSMLRNGSEEPGRTAARRRGVGDGGGHHADDAGVLGLAEGFDLEGRHAHAGGQPEHQLHGLGGVLQVGGAAREDDAGGQQVLVELRRVIGEDLVELAQHVLADEIQRLLVAQRADLGDGPAVELLIAEAAVAVLPDGLVEVGVAVHRRGEALLEVLRGLAADAQPDAQVVGDVLPADRDGAGAEDVLLVVEDPVGGTGAHIDEQHPALLLGLGRDGAGRGVRGEDEVAQHHAHGVHHAHAQAKVGLVHRDAPEEDLEPAARHAHRVDHGTVVQDRRLAHVEDGRPAGRGLKPLGRGHRVEQVLARHAAVRRRHGDDALHALALGGRPGHGEVDLGERPAGAALDVVDDLVDAALEFLEVGDGALDDPVGAPLGVAQHAGLAVDELADEGDGLVRADVDDGDERR